MTVAMQLSIAMASYNGGHFLQQQLDSFLAQTRLPDELVVCDDGSNDDTIKILDRFAKDSPFTVRLYRNPENLGHERNFSKAIELCTGDVIFLSDQDDVWFPSKLAAVEEVFDRDESVLLVINDTDITDAHLHPTGRSLFAQTKAAGVIGDKGKSLTLGCATAFRSQLRSLIAPVPALDYGHDSWIHDFAHLMDVRHVLDLKLQFYRRHGNNVSNWAFNGSDRATMRNVIQPSLGQDLRAAYEKRITTLDVMSTRLAALGTDAYSKFGARRSYGDVLAEIQHARQALSRRKRMFEDGWWSRKVLALTMWFSRDYRYFLGWKSLAKDLWR